MALASCLRLAGFDTSDDCSNTVDPDRAIVEDFSTKAPNQRSGSQSLSHVFLGISRRAPVEPFVEVESERFLHVANACQARASKKVDQFAPA